MTNSNYTYRRASIKDKEQLKNLAIVSYGTHKDALTVEHWTALKDVLNDEEKLEELMNISICFICLDEDEIIGMAHFIPHNNPWGSFKTEWSYIRLVGVNPKYKGQGIAKALTKICIGFGRETNEKTIALHTAEFMNGAIHIYESLGFKMFKEIEPRFGKKYWLYILELN